MQRRTRLYYASENDYVDKITTLINGKTNELILFGEFIASIFEANGVNWAKVKRFGFQLAKSAIYIFAGFLFIDTLSIEHWA